MVSLDYVAAVNKAVLVNELLQFSNGGLTDGSAVLPAVRETIAIHDEKLKKLESIIGGSCWPKRVLVVYAFQFDKERIWKKFPKAVFFDDDPHFVKNSERR